MFPVALETMVSIGCAIKPVIVPADEGGNQPQVMIFNVDKDTHLD